MARFITADEAAALIPNDAVVTVSSSSGLGCPNRVLRAIGERFESAGHPRGLTTLHPIAAGDMYGIKGIDHLAKPGLLARVIAGSFPSGPSSLPMPAIWRLIVDDEIPAYNVPSGILFDMTRDAAAKRPDVLTKVGLGTFVDPELQGCAMNDAAAADPIVRRTEFDGDTWLYFPAIVPDVAIIRGTTADDRGNISWEHEGAYLGALDQALAARNNGGIVIAQVKRRADTGTLKPMAVHVPGVLVDYVVVEPEQWQTTQTVFDPSICGEAVQPEEAFTVPEFGPEKVIARRVVAKVEWHPGELYPRVGFIVTNLGRPAERVVAFYNQRGTAEQWIKEGKNAIRWTRLSCRRFDHNAVRLQLHALACNLGNFMRTLALPDAVEQWSLTSLREKLIKIGAKIVRHGRYVTFQMAEVVIPRDLFADILRRIDRLRPPPAPA